MHSAPVAIPMRLPVRKPVMPPPRVPAEVEAALNQVLTSPLFCRSRRISRLLRYLVEQSVSGNRRETSEYSIGIAVFDRDPGSYDTCDDPIVRVQAGRLRAKLRSYYATSGNDAPLRFAIPLGSYMPEIVTAAVPRRTASVRPLVFKPLTVADPTPAAMAYAADINDELTHQLFKALGPTVMRHAGQDRQATLELEGSIRIDGACARISLRLLAGDSGVIAWSQQYDAPAGRSIAAQERLAQTISSALQRHFADSEPAHTLP